MKKTANEAVTNARIKAMALLKLWGARFVTNNAIGASNSPKANPILRR